MKDMRWSLVTATTSTGIFISDTPVVSIALDRATGVKFGVGVRNPSAQWFLPISPRRAIRVAHKPDLDLSAQLNMAQVLTAHRRVYGKTEAHEMNDMVQLYCSVYKFHVHVFKGTFDPHPEDEFDQVFAAF